MYKKVEVDWKVKRKQWIERLVYEGGISVTGIKEVSREHFKMVYQHDFENEKVENLKNSVKSDSEPK